MLFNKFSTEHYVYRFSLYRNSLHYMKRTIKLIKNLTIEFHLSNFEKSSDTAFKYIRHFIKI